MVVHLQQITDFLLQRLNVCRVPAEQRLGGAQQYVVLPGHHENSALVLRSFQVVYALPQGARDNQVCTLHQVNRQWTGGWLHVLQYPVDPGAGGIDQHPGFDLPVRVFSAVENRTVFALANGAFKAAPELDVSTE